MTIPQTKDITIGRLKPVQIDEIAGFFAATDADFFPPLSRRTDLKAYAEKIASKGEMVGARQNGKLMGLAVFYCNDKTFKRAYVSYLAVSRAARNAGLGTELMRKVIEICKEAGMETVELQTDGDRDGTARFYARLGFERCGSYMRFGTFLAVRFKLRLR